MSSDIIPHHAGYYDAAREALGHLAHDGGVFDLHLDLILRWLFFRLDVTRQRPVGPYGQNSMNLWSHSDLARLPPAGYAGACLGLHSRHPDSPRAWQDYLDQIAHLDRLGQEPGYFRIRQPADWQSAWSQGRIGLAPGVEGAHMLDGHQPDLLNSRLDRMAADGVAYVTLCHTFNSCAAPTNYTPTLGVRNNVPENPDHSLTPFGERVIDGLIQRGIAVDLAHVHSKALHQACQILRTRRTPALCTHAGYHPEPGLDRTLRDPRTGRRPDRYFRSLSHDDAAAIVSTGGLIGVFFAPMFLGHTGKHGDFPNSSRRIAQQIRALVQPDFSWIDHVAIGTDYDGFIDLPDDQRECQDLIKVVDALLQLGFNTEHIRKIFRTNATRVLTALTPAPAPAPTPALTSSAPAPSPSP